MVNTTTKPYLGATPNPAEATRDAMTAGKSGRIPLVEMFYSLQGEGLRSGQPTVFIRTAGCNCDCWFCDTDFRLREALEADEIIARAHALSADCRWACITGGEPTIHDLGELCNALHVLDWRIQIETNGGLPRPDWHIDHITVSPKERQGQRLAPWYLTAATEFKYVIDDQSDLAYAIENSSLHDKAAFLQPNALGPEASQLCIDAVLAHPARLRLSLQTHKLLGIR
jgi:organic radical activating enzyme